MTFFLFGPFAQKKNRLTIIAVDENSKSTSCAKSRKDDRKAAANKHEQEICNTHNPAGMEMNDRVNLANLSFQNISLENNKRNQLRLKQ